MQVEKIPNNPKEQEVEIYRFFFIPIAILLCIVPLIVRLQVINADAVTAKIFKSEQISDFFSQSKAHAIIIFGGIILFMLMISFGWQEFKKTKIMWIYYSCFAVFLLTTGIATLCSSEKNIAIWGMADRCEGMWVIFAYVIILFYTIYIVNKEADYKFLIRPLIVLVLISAVLGVFQYIGFDLLTQTKLGRSLIIPKNYIISDDAISSAYTSHRIHGTMYHYNYMGSFTAMMIPLFGIITLFTKDKKKKIVLGITFLASLFLLFGSTSRAGLIGVGISLLFTAIIFFKEIKKHIKKLGIAVLGIFIFIVVLNIVTRGVIFERIPTLINDIKAIVLPVSKDFDYKDELPIRNIQTKDNSIELELQDSMLIIEADPYDIYFKDENGNNLEFTRDENGYSSTEAKYRGMLFTNKRMVEENNTTKDYVVIRYNDLILWIVAVNTDQGAYLVEVNTYEPLTLEEPQSFGFTGKEKLGSARGYIWSRSIPLLKDTVLRGYGPDNYPLHFPQNDFFGKWYAYGTPYMIVDKPHNLYLQIALNQGCIALIAFLLAVIVYIVQSIKLYIGRGSYDQKAVIGSACLCAIVGYLGAGIFNDSIVSVAPIFWIVWGFGIATNYLCQKEHIKI